MSDVTEIKRGPGRPSNAELAARQPVQSSPAVQSEPKRVGEVKTRRRRREGMGDERNYRLHVPESMKDPNFVYRWVNDRAGRVRQMTVEDDWDVVDTSKLGGDPNPAANIAEGSVINRIGDKYTGERTVLIRKPKDYFEEDQEVKENRRKQIEAAMRRKAPDSLDGLGAADNAYVPNGGVNRIERE